MEPETHTAPTFADRWLALSHPRRFLILAVGLIGLAVVLALVRTGFDTGMQNMGMSYSDGVVSSGRDSFHAPMMAKTFVGTDSVSGGDYALEAPASMPTYNQGGGTGTYDESTYETRSYSATIETGDIDRVCHTIESWKPQQSVVFEQATRSERYCSYQFKVESAQADAILAAVKALNPKDLSVNTESMKRQMVQYDGQLEILLRKQAILEDTLESSSAAFDELLALAKSGEDVETLSKVIDKKLAQIERLTSERVTLAAQLQQLSRTLAELEDRIDFVYFSVYVQKDEVIDGEAVKDSWMAALQDFATNVNHLLQSLTLGLLLNLLALAQILVYLGILLVVAKYGWGVARQFWRK